MSFLACIPPVVTFLCHPVLDAVEAWIGSQVHRFLVSLTIWVDSLFSRSGGPGVEAVQRADEVPEPAHQVLGVEKTISVIRDHLKDESVQIIGIYGMGGVGKTTMLQRVNNEFLEPGNWGSFELVIWVTVSQTNSILNIQQQIAQRLVVSLPGSSEEENAAVLLRELSSKRFLVLLDDLWEALEPLHKIGIPSLKRRRGNSKIVFTTRSLQVCSDMDANKSVQVKPLDRASAWNLFCGKLSIEMVIRTNPTLRALAEQVVDKCGGLPLALITVGRAMADRVLVQEWVHAVDVLDHSAELLHGMDKVLGCLKFSYDFLKTDNMRSALLFCAMYPDDKDIRREELITYWIGEGLLDDDGEGSMDKARNRGQFLISDLQRACLLEPHMGGNTVRVHNAVRDMVFWLNNHGDDDEADEFLMYGPSTYADSVRKKHALERVKRIWVRNCDLVGKEKWDHAVALKSCSRNRTLLLTNAGRIDSWNLREIACSMDKTLRVPDLSGCENLEELPEEVGLMTELRFLDISTTRIKTLPKALGNLVKLRQLVMKYMLNLQGIPQDAIAGVKSLQVLDMWATVYDWPEADTNTGLECGGQQLSMRTLETGLCRLEELSLQMGSPHALMSLLSSKKLCSCTRHLCLVKPGSKLQHGYKRGCEEDPRLYGEGGRLLEELFRSGLMGNSLRELLLYGDDSHPWQGALSLSLDQLPLLDYFCLSSFRGEGMPEVFLIGATNIDSSVIPGLRSFHMSSCKGLKALKLVGRFPCLQEICLYECDAVMSEIALEDGAVEAVGISGVDEGSVECNGDLSDSNFPVLGTIYLYKLPALRNMGRRPLRLPELRSLVVGGCPELRRIPLEVSGVPKLGEIRGDRQWWDAVECSDLDSKPVFERLFVTRDWWI